MTCTLRRLAAVPALVFATAFTVACDDDITDPSDQLIGDFEATEAVFTSTEDPTTTFDVVAEDGTFDVRFDEDRTFTSTLAIPGRTSVVRTGTFDVVGSDLFLTEDGVTRTVPFTRTATGLTFTDPGDRFDFEGTGTAAPASFDVTLRQL